MQQTSASAGVRQNLLSKSYWSKSSNRVATRRFRADSCSAKSIGIRAILGIICVTTALFQASRLYAQAADSSGLPALEEVIAASGGRAAWGGVRDFRATGAMSLYSGGKITQSGRAELVGRGLKQFRLTANLGDQSRMWLWDRGFGRLDAGSGSPSLIGRHNLTALEGFNLPALKAVAFCDGPSRSVTLVGVEAVDGTPAYRVRIIRQAMNREDQVALGRASFQIDFLVDQ
jgi:hypothetical protein